jgi:ribosomal protein L11 methyltransferase
VPYRLDLSAAGNDALDRLIELGALDVEIAPAGGIAAVMPDAVAPGEVARTLGLERLVVSPAAGRDADSVWVLRTRPISVAGLRIVPAGADAESGALRLIDAAAFGTGLHPTTALCLEALREELAVAVPDAVLDVGTGSGVLALAALMMGVPRALGIDVDAAALDVARRNARLNGVGERVELALGGPEAVSGAWPLIAANVLAAPLIEMAPSLVQRLGHHGLLVLSGIPCSVEQEVEQAYRRLGLRRLRVMSRAGWIALVFQASW